MPATSINEAFCAKLKDILGTVHVYPDMLPKKLSLDSFPAVLYQLEGRDDGQNLTSKSRLRFASFRVEIYCPDPATARSRKAANDARELITEAFAGVNCRGDWSGIIVTGAVTEDPSADADPLDLASENYDRIERLTVRCNYRQPDPAA